MKKNKIIMIAIIVFLVLFLSFAVAGYLYNDKLEKEKEKNRKNNKPIDNTPVEVKIPEDAKKLDIPIVEIENLEEKIKKLDFEDKKSSQIDRTENKSSNRSSARMKKEDVVITLRKSGINSSYTLSSIKDIKKILMFDNGYGSTLFVLTENGKLYEVYFVDNDIKEMGEEFEPTINEVNMVPIKEMAQGKNDFVLNNRGSKMINKLYLKTTDNRIITNDYVMEGNKQPEFVQVVEKK